MERTQFVWGDDDKLAVVDDDDGWMEKDESKCKRWELDLVVEAELELVEQMEP